MSNSAKTKWELELEEYKKEEEIFQKGYQASNKGIQQEESGNVDLAIKYYEQSISYKFIGSHPYRRLSILYHERKQYDDEIRVIKSYFEIYPAEKFEASGKISWFKNRLQNAEKLKGECPQENFYNNNDNLICNITIDNITPEIILQRIDSGAITGYQFEEIVSKILGLNGFVNVETTKASGDYGIDVLAEKDSISYAVQCKCYSKPVGNKAVQEAYTGKMFYKKMVAVVITNNTFTKSAVETAEATQVLLWDRIKLTEMMKKLSHDDLVELANSIGITVSERSQPQVNYPEQQNTVYQNQFPIPETIYNNNLNYDSLNLESQSKKSEKINMDTKKMHPGEILIFVLECALTFLWIIFTILGFSSYGAKSGFIILLSALIISPLGNEYSGKLFEKLKVEGNSVIIRFGLQVFLSSILLFIGIIC